MAEKHNELSYMSTLFEKAGTTLTKHEEDAVKYTAASLYTGGADTVSSSTLLLHNKPDRFSYMPLSQTVSSMATFFLVMTLHPQVQRKAQEEIDRVIGTHRLPTFDDRDSLPYVEAVVKEAYRMHPIAPMGLPHITTADDVYEGYRIPKGAIVISNIWFVFLDCLIPNPRT